MSRYDSLAQATVFLQGHPWDHVSAEYQKHGTPSGMSTLLRGYAYEKTEPFFNARRHFEHTGLCKRTYETMFEGGAPDRIYFSDGAQWIVLRADLLARPKAFYQRLLEDLSIDRATNTDGIVNAWTMEGVWQFVFDPAIPPAPEYFERQVCRWCMLPPVRGLEEVAGQHGLDQEWHDFRARA